MVLHVWEAARAARRLDRVVVATDDERIAACVREAGGEAVMTSPGAASGTDRVAEVARAMPADAYVNLQGDEPLMPAENVDRAVDDAPRGARAVARDARDRRRDAEAAADPELRQGRRGPRRTGALFLAVADPILPQRRARRIRKHLGIYAYRAATLAEVAALPPSPLERAESLEQLRWLEAGYTIWVGEAAGDSIGVDTPADLANAERR